MRKLLLAGLALASFPVAALAVDFEGLPLHSGQRFPLNSPGVFQPQVLTYDYSNVTTFTGSAYPNGGAGLEGSDMITRLVADDLTPTGADAGLAVSQIYFSVVNFNAVAVSARPRVRFWQADGAGGGPGTFIAGFTFNAISFAATSAGSFFFAPAGMVMPGTKFWAGITFDDNSGATGATAAQLNNLGQAVFDPPTVGSSADVAFTTSIGGSFLVNNPAGGMFNFSGSPHANFFWAFNVDVPSPTKPLTWGRVKSLYR